MVTHLLENANGTRLRPTPYYIMHMHRHAQTYDSSYQDNCHSSVLHPNHLEA